ncbi:MAG: DUF1192 domain-containing protein [Salinarimonadaceae bacterium]|nr:MAG: DUF1192 domain-containing protein [Salinarimonadaceae bacterium]
MAFDPTLEETPRKPDLLHEVGRDLATLSVDEINERIAVLLGEIERLREARTKKEASKSAADAFFKAKP